MIEDAAEIECSFVKHALHPIYNPEAREFWEAVAGYLIEQYDIVMEDGVGGRGIAPDEETHWRMDLDSIKVLSLRK